MEHQSVATQLSIALADLAIQMDTAWPRVPRGLLCQQGDPCNLCMVFEFSERFM